MSKSRLLWLEQQLERDDLTDLQFDCYNHEANCIQAEINARKAELDKIREQQRIEEQEEIELAKVLSLTEDQVEKMYEDSCTKYQDVNGVSFKDWYAQSLKYYSIDEKFNVHARARSANTVEIVEHPTLAQAKLTILTRIKYKFYDHAVRGRDFAYEMEETVSST